MKKIIIILCCILFLLPLLFADASDLSSRLKGRILLQVEEKGEAWYVEPDTKERAFLGRPDDAFRIMRELGLGISEKDFNSFGEKAPERLSGKILLRVEANGEAYYVNPIDLKMHFLGRPADAFQVMRNLGLGITNENLNKVSIFEKYNNNNERKQNKDNIESVPTPEPITPEPEPVCTSWRYSDWEKCSSNGQQYRSIIISSPLNCSGGNPVLSQSCLYVTTEVNGIISSNTTWSLKNGPYVVTGNILVNDGVVLTIEPGVEIIFKKHPMRGMGYTIKIDGTLVSKGTEKNKITFTSENKQPGDWGAIYFSASSTDWNENSGNGSIIENSIIEYGGSSQDRAINARDTLIGISHSAPLIKNNILRFSDADAIRIETGISSFASFQNNNVSNDANQPKIINNIIQTGRIFVFAGDPYFSGNEITGEGFYIVGGAPIIINNNIINNSGCEYGGGIRIDRGAPKITYNNIINNESNGISILGGTPIIENNNISNNKVFSILLTDIKDSFNFPNNWWGTTDASIISSSIHDFNKDFNLGKVNYKSIANSEILNAGIKKD